MCVALATADSIEQARAIANECANLVEVEL
jgi:formate-dependent phosphoribosylglycinamide formyltransferase (GAR transformylase)